MIPEACPLSGRLFLEHLPVLGRLDSVSDPETKLQIGEWELTIAIWYLFKAASCLCKVYIMDLDWNIWLCKKKKKILVWIASEKQNSNCIREDNEETSFSCNVTVCVRVPVVFFAVCGGMGVSTGIGGPLWHVFSLRRAKKGLHRGVCVCVFVAGWMAEMCKLGRSVWHTETPPRRILMHQVQFNLEYLTTQGIVQKGNPFILFWGVGQPTHVFFSFLFWISRHLFHQPLLYLKSDCNLLR